MKRLTLVGLLLLCACGGEEGFADVRLYGAGAEEGLPADSFADDWAVSFERFSVTVENVGVAGTLIGGGAAQTKNLVEPSEGQGQLLGTVSASPDQYTSAGFIVGPLEVTGAAVRGAEGRRFTWAIPAVTRYSACEAFTDLREGETATFQITLLASELFRAGPIDDEAPPVFRFDAFAAADTDADGEITEAELKAAPSPYDAGSLWGWLLARKHGFARVAGELSCQATVLAPLDT